MARSLRSDRYEDPIQKLYRDLQTTGLLGVLESLPAPDSYKFQQTRQSGRAAIKLCLGNRSRVDGSQCQAWARIVPTERPDLQPPVVFYDQESSEDVIRSSQRQYSLSATSLLRRATDLEPPFCFLQHDSFDEVRGARNMLCAIVLYQAMVTGVETCALEWNQFQDSLSQALRFINSRNAYHQWRHDEKLAAIRRISDEADCTNDVAQGGNDAEVSDSVTEESQSAFSSSGNYTGGEVRPSRTTIIKPNTSLARLKAELGDKKSHFLDEMPRLPMKITPHNLGSSYFPFCMLIGSHTWSSGEPFQVYAYLEQGKGKGAIMRFLSHDETGHEQSFTMDQLLGISLLQPLEHLNNFKKNSYASGGGTSARTAKIRSVISYYFFLAENEGLIGNPRVTIGEAFAKRLCAAIREMRGIPFSDDEGGDENGQDHSLEQDTESSRIVTVQPDRPRSHPESRPSNSCKQQNHGDCEDPSADESPAENEPNMQLESRLSSQSIREGKEDLTLICSAPSTEHQSSMKADQLQEYVGADHDHQRVCSEASQSDPTVCGARSANMPPMPNDIRSDVNLVGGDSNSVGIKPTIPTADMGLPKARAVRQSPAKQKCPLAAIMDRDPEPRAAVDSGLSDNHETTMKFPSPTSIRSPISVRSPSRAISISANTGRDNPASNCLFTDSHDVRIQIVGLKPPTPEGSTEREETSQMDIGSRAKGSQNDPMIIDSGSDDENITAESHVPRVVFRQDQRAWTETIDLTPSSPPSRGKKRKASLKLLQVDSEDDILEETDGSAYRWAQSRRRR